MAYKELASMYDLLMRDAPYEQWVSFTETIISKMETPSKKILDLGCGTGEITLLLANNGYNVTGVDYSSEMLAHAEQKSNLRQLPVQWIQQNLIELQGFQNIDVAISYCDVINYIVTEKELKTVFSHIYDALKPGGVFIFDVHDVNYVEDFMINHTFTDINDDVAYIWDCLPGDSKGEMFHEITFFEEDQEGKYDRFDESHHQRTYPISFYEDILHKCGFEKTELYDDFSTKNFNDTQKHERIFFVTYKRSG